MEDLPYDCHEKVWRVIGADAKRMLWEDGKLLDDCCRCDGEEDSVSDAVSNLTEYEDDVCDVEAQGAP